MSARQLGFAGRIARYFINSKLTPLIMVFSVLLGAFATPTTWDAGRELGGGVRDHVSPRSGRRHVAHSAS
jgi:hypothetical protein